MFYYYINNDFCNTQNIDGKLDWLVINYFCKPINNDKN